MSSVNQLDGRYGVAYDLRWKRQENAANNENIREHIGKHRSHLRVADSHLPMPQRLRIVLPDSSANFMLRPSALLLRVASERAEAARDRLILDGDLGTVEIITRDDGTTLLRVPPGAVGRVAAISEALRAIDVPIEELIVQQGTLDDVFHDITADIAHRENPYA